jgi:spore coat protein A, manganese oxidase
MTRRSLFRALGAAGVVKLAGRNARASYGVPQVALPGRNIPKYVEPLATFPFRISGQAITVSVEEFRQRVLPLSSYPSLAQPFDGGTLVWGYRVGSGPPLFPGFTIEAQRGVTTRVTYVNNLPLLPVLQRYLTIDQTIHWAAPTGMMMNSAQPYSGPPPIVTHLHGAEVPSAYDGGPEQWFTPNGVRGPTYRSAVVSGGNSAIYDYPNTQEATTLWFHDHTLGATRLNVYAGLAAFYLLRDSRDTGRADNAMGLPAGPFEIELALQDRQFDTGGQLFFPDSDDDSLNGGPPNPGVHPFWIPEFFGDAMVVNGKTWPYLEVEPRRYRFRLLNGCNSRFLELWLNSGSEPAIWQIGSDGGFLNVPVKVSGSSGRLLLAPGERADVVIDFSRAGGQTITLLNSAKAPYPSGAPPDPQTTGQIMQFRVTLPLSSTDATFNPALGAPLRAQPIVLVNPASSGRVADATRQLTLVEVQGADGPLEVLVNNTKWGALATETPRVGSTEVWEIVNTTMDAHPIHLHLVQFQVIGRQAFQRSAYWKRYSAAFAGGAFVPAIGPPLPYSVPNAAGALGGNPDIAAFLQGPVRPPEPNETGWKDTVKAYPGEVTRIAVRWAPQNAAVADASAGVNLYAFDPTVGPGYAWHCHIIDHEDNEMMRPYHPVP